VLGLTSTFMLALAVPALVVHLAAIALARALQSYSRSRLEEFCSVRGHLERAAEVAHLDERTERAAEAIAVVTGLFLAALGGAWLGGLTTPPDLVPVVVLSLAIAVAGYLVVGAIGRVFAEPMINTFWPLTWLIRGTAWPLWRGSEGLEELLERLVVNPESGPRPASVEVEIPTEEGENSEDVEAELTDTTRALLQHAVELSRTDVSEVMIPAPAVVSMPVSVSARQAAETFRRTGRSRIPIFGSSRDDIIGILIGKDLWDRMIEVEESESVVPAKLVRPAFCVPETCNAFELVDQLRRNRTQMAIVLDEYGSVAGLVTLEDLLEQLVGPIDDEHDVPTPADPIRSLGGSRFEVDAAIPLERLNERLDLHLPTGEDFQTVGGLAFHALGRLPEQGATFRYDEIEFTVVDVRDHSIRKVMIDLQPAVSTPGASTQGRVDPAPA
jgi:CBS domain containing-hemolysin-like protein